MRTCFADYSLSQKPAEAIELSLQGSLGLREVTASALYVLIRSLDFSFFERYVGPGACLFGGFNRRFERFDRAQVVEVTAHPHGAKSIEHTVSNCVCRHLLPSRDQGDNLRSR